jgi:hypothetical protein
MRTVLRCPECDRAPAPIIKGLEAARHRNHFAVALGPESDVQAYAYCISTVLCGEHKGQECQCDRDAWAGAVAKYDEKGAAACWAELGVTEEIMKQADMARRRELEEEKEVRDGFRKTKKETN